MKNSAETGCAAVELRIELLGGFVVQVNGTKLPDEAWHSRRARNLVRLLALTPAHRLHREVIAATLWPDSDPAASANNFHQTLYTARRILMGGGQGCFVLEDGHLHLLNGGDCRLIVDVDAFETAAAGLSACADPLLAQDPLAYQAALALYKGDLLPDDLFEEWTQLRREALRRVYYRLTLNLALLYETRGEYGSGIEQLHKLLASDRSNEEAHTSLMRLYALNGQRQQALRQFESCKLALEQEFGVEPAEETLRVAAMIRAGKIDDLRWVSNQAQPGSVPYRGLCCFDEADAGWFFGREELTARLAERLGTMAKAGVSALAVVGASGSGKSSLLRAGVAPMLRKVGWEIRIITPGPRPAAVLDRLAGWGIKNSLSRQRLLVVDQFEELFSLCREEEQRCEFLERLFALQAVIVLALRADFYGHCASYPQLRALLSEQQEYIGAMNTAGLRRAIEEPAHRGGWELEPGLAELLLDEVGSSNGREPEPGGLPLLQHALLETWQRRRGRVMTLSAYQEAGGVRGAVAQTAERVYGRLSPDDRTLARRIFLRLTELGDGTQDTRRRAGLQELRAIGADQSKVDALLEALTTARLVTLAEDSAEVAHEALIREWPALQRWLTDNREGLRLHRQITERAAAWEILGHDEGELFRGTRLAQALEWAGLAEHSEELTGQEAAFLAASLRLSLHEAEEHERLHQQELDVARKLADAERKRAIEHQEAALRLYQEGRYSYARELAAHAKGRLTTEPDLSLLLALEAVAVLRKSGLVVPWDIQQALHDVALTARLLWVRETSATPWATNFSPNGRRVLYEDSQDVFVLDAVTGEELLCVRAGGSINAAYLPDGRFIVTANATRACLWDAISGEKWVSFPLPGAIAAHGKLNAISPDGRLLHVNVDETTGMLLDLGPWLAAGSPQAQSFPLPMKTVARCSWDTPSVTFSPDGKLFTTPWLADNTLTLWDTAAVQPLRSLAGYKDFPSGVSFSPDGHRIASCSIDGAVRISDVDSGQDLLHPAGHMGLASVIKYSPDGLCLASSGAEGAVIVWDAVSGYALFSLPTGGSAFGVAYSPNGERLFVSQFFQSVQLYDATPGGIGEFQVATGERKLNHFSPDGTRIIQLREHCTVDVLDAVDFQCLESQKIPWAGSCSPRTLGLRRDNRQLALLGAGELLLWDLQARQVIFERPVELEPAYSHNALAFHPDGKRIALCSQTGLVSVWDSSGERPDLDLPIALLGIRAAEFSPDGKFLAVGGFRDWDHSFSGDVWVWDLARLPEPVWVFQGDLREIVSLTFSPDGSRLAVAGWDSHAEIWDISSGKRLVLMHGHTGVIRSARYSPDGRCLVTASEDGTAKAWDASSGTELLSFRPPGQGVIERACFTPDGRRVLVAKDGGGESCRYYWLAFQDFDELTDLMRRRITRTWKPAERSRYLRRD